MCPYATIIEENLSLSTPETKVSCDTFADCGLSTRQVLLSLQNATDDGNYNYHCILAGTNDIGKSADPDSIVRNLREVCQCVVSRKSVPILITIPAMGRFSEDGGPSRSRHWNRYVVDRHYVNSQLPALALEFGGDVVDLFSETSIMAQSGAEWEFAETESESSDDFLDDAGKEASGVEGVAHRKITVRWMDPQLCSDGLHFNEKGYKVLAALVQRKIQELLLKDV